MSVVAQPQLETTVESSFESAEGRLIRTIVTKNPAGGVGHLSRTFVPDSGTGASLDAWWRAYFHGNRPQRLDESSPGRIRTAELFCGPGGLGLGFEQAAMELGYRTEVAAIVDQDAGAVGVYSRNRRVGIATSESVTVLVDHKLRGSRSKAYYPDGHGPQILDDRWRELRGSIDVVLAGPPCQGHSNLNNKTRRNDLRNELYLSVPAMAIALDAPMIVIENVPAVVHDALGVVETTRTLLEAAGYVVRTGVLKAANMGWHQTRSRFFLIARKGAVPLDLPGVEVDLSDSPRSASWAFADLPVNGRPSFMTDVPDMSAENRDRIEWLFANGEYDLPNEHRPDCHKDGTTYNSVYGRIKPDVPAQTVTTGFFTAGRGRYIHPTKKRVINAAEAARLQGFPDNYDFHPEEDVVPSRSQLGKWIGDAVPMPLGFAAGLAVLGASPVIPQAR